MTERSPESGIAIQLTRIAALHIQMATAMAKLAALADQRNFVLRRDMVANYSAAAEEAQQLFAMLSTDIAGLRAQIGTLPTDLETTIATIEDDLAHLKQMMAGPEEELEVEPEEGGTGSNAL